MYCHVSNWLSIILFSRKRIIKKKLFQYHHWKKILFWNLQIQFGWSPSPWYKLGIGRICFFGRIPNIRKNFAGRISGLVHILCRKELLSLKNARQALEMKKWSLVEQAGLINETKLLADFKCVGFYQVYRTDAFCTRKKKFENSPSRMIY